MDQPLLGEPYLLTPGPLTTSYSVKQAMLRDWGSWDIDFRAMTAEVQASLLQIAGVDTTEFDCVPMQGSGTFAMEAMLGSFIPKNGKALVLANGAYGKRAAETLKYLGRDYAILDKGDYLPPRGHEIAQILENDPLITHVVAIHCETSSGILNPIAEISKATYQAGRKLLIDAMSSFGAIALDPQEIRFEALVSSSNKCLEGVPGFGFIIARKTELRAAKGNTHSLSLDLHAQWMHMHATGQWRFTPPTHVVAAFLVALKAHKTEGGITGRGTRYQRSCDVIVAEMQALGFQTLLAESWLSPIIVTFFCPADPKFSFLQFYELLKTSGFIIYPGKLTNVESFRIGCIGQLDEHVMRNVAKAVKNALAEMGVRTAAPPTIALTERAKLQA